MIFSIETLQALEVASAQEHVLSKTTKRKKKRSIKSSTSQRSTAAEDEEQLLSERPSTPPAAWPPRCISGTGPPCARKPAPSLAQPSSPSASGAQLHRGTMSSRPVSAPPNARAAAPHDAKPAAATHSAQQAPDLDSNQPSAWSVDAPLPSIRTVKGREQFLQTPAFVIAAHYERGETLRAKAHRNELSDKLKQAARFQKAVVQDKMDLEDELRRTTSELEWYKAENLQMKLKCTQLSEQLLVVQRSARDSKAANNVLSQQVQAKQAMPGATQQMRHDLAEARSEVVRLKARLVAAGIKEP